MSTPLLYTQLAKARKYLKTLQEKLVIVTEKANIADDKEFDEQRRIKQLKAEMQQRINMNLTGNLGNELANSLREYQDSYNKYLTKEEQSRDDAKLVSIHKATTKKIEQLIRPQKEKLYRLITALGSARKKMDTLRENHEKIKDKISEVEAEINTLEAQELASNQGQAVPAVPAVPARRTRRTRIIRITPTGRGRRLRRSTHKPKKGSLKTTNVK